jgi:hypothetical protein
MSEAIISILNCDCGTLRSDLITSRQTTAQGRRILIQNPDTGKTFLFSEAAYRLLQSLQPGIPARNSIAAAFADAVASSPASAQLVAQAHAAALLTGGRLPASEEKVSIVHKASKWNLLYIQIPILNPLPVVRILRPLARIIFHPATFGIWAAALLIVSAAIAMSWKRYGWELVIFRNFAWWPVLYCFLAGSAIVHEMGHVMLCDRYGVPVRQMGLLFYFLNPGAYADVSGAWMLAERRKRVGIALAGLYVESMMLILVASFWLITKSGAFHEIAFVFAVCLVVRIAINLIPFLRLDGYWVLTDALGIPNLRTSAFRYLQSFLPGAQPPLRAVSAKDRAILLTYGIAALASLCVALASMLLNISAAAARLWPEQAAAGWLASGSIALILLVFAALNIAVRAGMFQPRNKSGLDT